jgi:hypothetical protein
MDEFIIAKWLSNDGKWMSRVGQAACGVVGSIGARRLDWGTSESARVCAGSVLHGRVWG